MKYFTVVSLLASALLLGGCGAAPVPTSQASQLKNLNLAGIRTAVARVSSVHRTLRLTGQVLPTETGAATITAPLSGVVVRPLVAVGDRVKKGQPVCLINSLYGKTGLQVLRQVEGDESALLGARGGLASARTGVVQARTSLASALTGVSAAESNLTQARAEVVNARINLKRKKELQKAGIYSVADVENAEERWTKAISAQRDAVYGLKIAHQQVQLARGNVTLAQQGVGTASQTLALAEANLERDKAALGETRLTGAYIPSELTPVSLATGGRYDASARAATFSVRSPIAGVLTSVPMTSGLSVSPGTVLASVVDTRTVYVDANAYEDDLPFLHAGEHLVVTSAADPDKHFNGRVISVGDRVDAVSRTVPVRSLIQNPSKFLRPSMFVSVAIESAPLPRAVMVPSSAILVHGARRWVIVQTGPDHYVKRAVKLGVHSGGMTQIASGVKAGEKVVTAGNLLLEGRAAQ